jgi:F0F1-type ATP synthase membrane subunit b/b'
MSMNTSTTIALEKWKARILAIFYEHFNQLESTVEPPFVSSNKTIAMMIVPLLEKWQTQMLTEITEYCNACISSAMKLEIKCANTPAPTTSGRNSPVVGIPIYHTNEPIGYPNVATAPPSASTYTRQNQSETNEDPAQPETNEDPAPLETNYAQSNYITNATSALVAAVNASKIILNLFNGFVKTLMKESVYSNYVADKHVTVTHTHNTPDIKKNSKYGERAREQADRAREQADRDVKRAREQADRDVKRAREQADRAREQADRAREQADRDVERAREQADRAREQADRARDQADRVRDQAMRNGARANPRPRER